MAVDPTRSHRPENREQKVHPLYAYLYVADSEEGLILVDVDHFTVAAGAKLEVVVKVQRPSVASLVRRDIKAMAWIAPFLVGRLPVAALANPPALVDLFATTDSALANVAILVGSDN